MNEAYQEMEQKRAWKKEKRTVQIGFRDTCEFK